MTNSSNTVKIEKIGDAGRLLRDRESAVPLLCDAIDYIESRFDEDPYLYKLLVKYWKSKYGDLDKQQQQQ